MELIIIIVVLLFIASKFDEETGASCCSGLLTIIFGVFITIIAFGINPILGIIVGYIVLQGWKAS